MRFAKGSHSPALLLLLLLLVFRFVGDCDGKLSAAVIMEEFLTLRKLCASSSRVCDGI